MKLPRIIDTRMKKINILILEDNKLDAELVKEEMVSHKIDFISQLVDTKKDFIAALDSFQPDLILSDYSLPQFTGFEAVVIAKEQDPDIPFILVTGNLTEELAAEAIKKGAWDYVLKENLIRLGPAIENSMKLKEEKDKNKETEKELIKLSSAVKQSANAIIITDIDAKIIYTNPKFTDLTGYTREEALGKNPSMVSSGKQTKEYYSTLWKTILAGKTWQGEFHNKSKDGSLFWEHATISPIKDAEGNIINFLGIKEDITALKKSELVLKESEGNLLDAQKIAQIGSFNLDLKTLIAKTSTTYKTIIGIDVNTEVSMALWRTIVHPEDNSNNQKALDNCIKNGERFDLRYRILTKGTQELKWIHGLGEVIYINKKPSNFIGTIQDITTQKNAEINLQNAYDEVEQLKVQLEEENVSLKEEISLSFNYEDLVYTSVEISDILSQVEQVSNTDATVLILGETGTGKELIAKAIHNTSERKKEPLIYVNCAAIPSELIESELFGHKKGSFTGAINNRIGKFQLADKGTLFLDEIGEMPLDLQPKLLRAIQNAEITPIGGSRVIKLDIRIIVATNKKLEKEVEKKLFREDLFFRLNVFPITVPPLRERIEDIPVLLDFFINKFSLKYRKDIKFISSKTLQQLKVYPWPGNVRELENLIERAVITSNNERLVFHEFDHIIKSDVSKRKKKHVTLEEIQSNHIIKTLNLTQWKISGENGAASLLDIKPSTLRDRMIKFGIVRHK